MRNKHVDGLLDYSAQNESKQLQDGVTKIIINSQVSAEGQSEDLKALAKLMNNEPVRLNKHFDYAQRRIKEINEDPEMREKIMLYETRMDLRLYCQNCCYLKMLQLSGAAYTAL